LCPALQFPKLVSTRSATTIAEDRSRSGQTFQARCRAQGRTSQPSAGREQRSKHGPGLRSKLGGLRRQRKAFDAPAGRVFGQRLLVALTCLSRRDVPLAVAASQGFRRATPESVNLVSRGGERPPLRPSRDGVRRKRSLRDGCHCAICKRSAPANPAVIFRIVNGDDVVKLGRADPAYTLHRSHLVSMARRSHRSFH
jgi:hypothetical protein